MDVKTFLLRNYYPRTIPLDDGVEGDRTLAGIEIPIRIRKFSIGELHEFQDGYSRLANPPHLRAIYRQPDGEEQQKHQAVLRAATDTMPARTEERYVIVDEEIERRRVAEMRPEVRAEFEAAQKAHEVFLRTFCSQAITDHIWLPPGVRLELEQNDGSTVDISDGPGLVKAFAGNYSMLIRLTSAIHAENTLSPEEKKALRSLSDFTRFLNARTADGRTPAAIVENASASASANSGPVTASPDRMPSGSTTT